MLLLAVYVGGALGALARWRLDAALAYGGHGWPWATFAANLGGTALLGYFVTRLQERLPPSTFKRPLLGTGLCGALTTFSTFQLELARMVRSGSPAVAVAYLAASLGAGLAVIQLATVLTRRARVR